MNIGTIAIPEELAPVLESAQQLGIRLIDTSAGYTWDTSMHAGDYRESIWEAARDQEVGRYECIHAINPTILCEFLGIDGEQADELSEQLDKLSELIVVCPHGREQEFQVDDDNALLIFWPGQPTAT